MRRQHKFEANVRVTAALMVLSPVNALLSFTSGINIWLGGLISLAVSFMSYLLYHALVGALKARKGRQVITIVLAGACRSHADFFTHLLQGGLHDRRQVPGRYEKYLKQNGTLLKISTR